MNQPLAQPTITLYGGLLTTTTVASAYQWYRNGTALPGATGNFCLPNATGIYMLRITDPNTCEFQYSPGYYHIYFPPQPLGMNDRSAELNTLQLYPNPNNGLLNISIEGLQEYEVNIHNINGELVYTDKNVKTVDMREFSNGLYFCTVKAEKSSITKKITLIK